MAENPRRPLLNPVLRFMKDPKPESVSGGGKNATSIMAQRLPEQRRVDLHRFRSGRVLMLGGLLFESHG